MHRYWNDGWSGDWRWMAIMMIAFWGGIIWIAVTLIRHTNRPQLPQMPGRAATTPARQTPQEILAERLARGEIEPDDYRQRLDALDHRPNTAR
jgi:putative membrane protein